MRMLGKRVAMVLGSVGIAAMMSGQVMAASLDASDMAFAFGGKAVPSAITRTAKAAAPKVAKPVVVASARTMTQAEMKDTDGAFGPWGALLGGTLAATEYGLSCGIARNCTAWGFARHTVPATIAGGFFPWTVGRYLGARTTAIGYGTLDGIAGKRGWW